MQNEIMKIEVWGLYSS